MSIIQGELGSLARELISLFAAETRMVFAEKCFRNSRDLLAYSAFKGSSSCTLQLLGLDLCWCIDSLHKLL